MHAKTCREYAFNYVLCGAELSDRGIPFSKDKGFPK